MWNPKFLNFSVGPLSVLVLVLGHSYTGFSTRGWMVECRGGYVKGLDKSCAFFRSRLSALPTAPLERDKMWPFLGRLNVSGPSAAWFKNKLKKKKGFQPKKRSRFRNN